MAYGSFTEEEEEEDREIKHAYAQNSHAATYPALPLYRHILGGAHRTWWQWGDTTRVREESEFLMTPRGLDFVYYHTHARSMSAGLHYIMRTDKWE